MTEKINMPARQQGKTLERAERVADFLCESAQEALLVAPDTPPGWDWNQIVDSAARDASGKRRRHGYAILPNVQAGTFRRIQPEQRTVDGRPIGLDRFHVTEFGKAVREEIRRRRRHAD